MTRIKLKVKIFLPVLLVLFTTGCNIGILGGFNAENLSVNKSYTLRAIITYGNANEIEVNLTRENISTWNGEIIEPYALQGYTADYLNGNLALSFSGMSVNIQPSDTENFGITLILDALESAFTCKETNDIEVKTIGSNIEISGTCDGGLFVLTLDRDTQIPVSLSIPEHLLTVSFSEVSVSEFNSVKSQPTFNTEIEADFAG